MTGSSYRRLPNEEVVTTYTFKVIESLGIKQNQLLNSSQIQVMVPGGNWNGIVYHTIGAPTFIENEKVLLILNQGEFGLGVEGLGLGKFQIKEFEGKDIFENSIYPENKMLSQFGRDDLNNLLQKKFGYILGEVKLDRVIARKDNDNDNQITSSRSPSSEANLNETQNSDNSMFYLLMLFLLIGLATYLRKAFSD
jgi:hypothetical protein